MSITISRRQLFAGAACTVTALALVGCGGEGAQPNAAPEERVYLDEADIDAMFTNPDDYTGKWVKLPGKTLGSSEKDGDLTALQAYYDIQTYDRTYIIHSSTTESFADGEYILVDGMISGSFDGENALGGSLTLPLITNAEITKSNYIDVAVPTIASIEPAVTASQNDVTVTCDKVEFAEAETRVYLTISNDRSDSVSCGVYEIRIIADGQQIEQDSSSSSTYEGNYPELSYDISAGAKTNGILVFPAIEPGTAFKLVVPDIYCDDYDTQFTDVELEIPAE